MRTIRCYCRSLNGPSVSVDSSQAHHLRDVLRLGLGGRVELFDGAGATATGRVQSIDRNRITFEIGPVHRVPPRTTGRVVLAVSLPKATRFDDIITRCTELGVDHIAAVRFDRTVKRGGGAAGGERWHRLIVGAAQQCGRVFLPRLTGPDDFESTIAALGADYPRARWLFGGLSEQAMPWRQVEQTLAEGADQASSGLLDMVAFIGPEGGLTDAEQQILRSRGAMETALTRTILRVETATIALGALMCTLRDGPAGSRSP